MMVGKESDCRRSEHVNGGDLAAFYVERHGTWGGLGAKREVLPVYNKMLEI
jgi:hypothetical protein